MSSQFKILHLEDEFLYRKEILDSISLEYVNREFQESLENQIKISSARNLSQFENKVFDDVDYNLYILDCRFPRNGTSSELLINEAIQFLRRSVENPEIILHSSEKDLEKIALEFQVPYFQKKDFEGVARYTINAYQEWLNRN